MSRVRSGKPISSKRVRSFQKLEELGQQFEQQFHAEAEKLRVLQQSCLENDICAIRSLMALTHLRHPLPTPLQKSFEFDLDRSARIALCTVEIPDFAGLGILRKRGDSGRQSRLAVSAANASVLQKRFYMPYAFRRSLLGG